jgi:hypothetical protein
MRFTRGDGAWPVYIGRGQRRRYAEMGVQSGAGEIAVSGAGGRARRGWEELGCACLWDRTSSEGSQIYRVQTESMLPSYLVGEPFTNERCPFRLHFSPCCWYSHTRESYIDARQRQAVASHERTI